MAKELSYPKHKIKILLLEGVHQVAVDKLRDCGYAVKEIVKSLSPDELMEEIRDAHVLGIRSKTKVLPEHLNEAKRLLVIGCFGVGTNQVPLEHAMRCGVPVFNAPFGNTRSVAELAFACIINLARKVTDKCTKMHQGLWDKSAKGAIEIRGKTLGLVGFGHIGQQVGVLAEACGMRVVFYDQLRRLPLGNARQVDSMKDLLAESDFISLHVPAMAGNRPLISTAELQQMKRGSYLLNLSRGSLIDFSALKEALQSGHIAGAAVDVYPSEPKTNSEPFSCELTGVENVILTPHLGGSTEEAQYNIGEEVAAAFINFIDAGVTTGAVNFPQVSMPVVPNTHRVLNVHKNEPGVLVEVNKIVSDLGVNIAGQFLGTHKDVGYLVMDVEKDISEELKNQIQALSSNIKTRILY